MTDPSKKKILHILTPDKFTLPFIGMVNKEFGPANHLFLCTSDPNTSFPGGAANVRFLRNPYRKYFVQNTALFFRCISNATRIILHGNPLLFYFIVFPWLPARTYWVIYGYEIDDSHVRIERTWAERFVRWFVLRRIGGHITHIEGDSGHVNRLFKSKAKFFYSPIYLSNVSGPHAAANDKEERLKPPVRILAGNNTSPTNNHESIFKMLLPYKEEDIEIYCPLSYGLYNDYRDHVIAMGREYFGSRFIAMTEFMKPEEYLDFIEGIDIAVFNHQRQEGMGVIIQLLNYGKIVYMNGTTTSYKSFINRGFRVFDNSLILKEGLFKYRDVSDNPRLTEIYYSYNELVSSWGRIFTS